MSASHLHVPTVGELVSPRIGSAIVTVARSLGEAQIRAGGKASFVVRAGMEHDTTPLDRIVATLPDKVWLTRPEKAVDAVADVIAHRRPRAEHLWAPVYDVIPVDHDGPVFLHSAPEAADGLRRRRPAAKPVVHLHNEVFRGWLPARRRAFVRQHGAVAVSRFIADKVVAEAADRDRILVLVNGVDTHQFRPAVAEVEPTVLFVGKVMPHKGPHLLVAAALVLADEGLRFRVRIVGSSLLEPTDALSDYERQLRADAEPLGPDVEFWTFADRTAIAEVYRSATIMVVPSDWDEPCSLTLPEGMASGLACIASRRGGLPESGGHAPLYFDPPDVVGLANHLRTLLTDQDERRERAALARARAEEISWDRQLATLNTWLAR